jgi:acetyl esterase/lipase
VATFPAQLLDAKAAVRWLRARAAGYNVDPDRIYAWGDSACGHLASLLGLTGGPPQWHGLDDSGEPTDVSDTVAAVAAWYPPTDLLRMGEQRLPDAAASADDPPSAAPGALLPGAQPAESPDKAAVASPITYAGDHAPLRCGVDSVGADRAGGQAGGESLEGAADEQREEAVHKEQCDAAGHGDEQRGDGDGAASVVVGEPAEDKQGEDSAGEVGDGDQ